MAALSDSSALPADIVAASLSQVASEIASSNSMVAFEFTAGTILGAPSSSIPTPSVQTGSIVSTPTTTASLATLEITEVVTTVVPTSTPTSTPAPIAGQRSALTVGQVIGIVVAVLVFLIALIVFGFLLRRRRRERKKKAGTIDEGGKAVQDEGGKKIEDEEKLKPGTQDQYPQKKYQVDDEATRQHELEAKHGRSELDGRARYELDGNGRRDGDGRREERYET